MNSRLQKMMPKNRSEFEDFADTLGEHCQQFCEHIQYKKFVEELISDLCQELPPEKITEISAHVKRLAQNRKKQEKSGNIEYHLKQPDEETPERDDLGLYDDFM